MMRHEYDGRSTLSLEAKVRAMKLWKIDGFEPEDILTDLENTFGVEIALSNWDRPSQFLKRIEHSLTKLCMKETIYQQRLLKLLKQAELIQADEDLNEDIEDVE